MLSGWRVAAPAYASTQQEMMSGEGAYLHGGRWNSKGVRVVYLGSSLAQASLELLVHLGRAAVLNSYLKMEVSFDESLMQYIDLEDLPDDWAEPTMASSVQAVGDSWVSAHSSLILQVPSAAVRGEYNYLCNPQHTDFKNLTFSPITSFNYDPRLIKEA
jgi:RES domain-containing protein